MFWSKTRELLETRLICKTSICLYNTRVSLPSVPGVIVIIYQHMRALGLCRERNQSHQQDCHRASLPLRCRVQELVCWPSGGLQWRRVPARQPDGWEVFPELGSAPRTCMKHMHEKGVHGASRTCYCGQQTQMRLPTIGAQSA